MHNVIRVLFEVGVVLLLFAALLVAVAMMLMLLSLAGDVLVWCIT